MKKKLCAHFSMLVGPFMETGVGGKYLRYWKYHLSFDDGKIFADIV